MEERYGREVFVTSVLGDAALIYPLAVWEEFEERLSKLPSTDSTKRRFLERVKSPSEKASESWAAAGAESTIQQAVMRKISRSIRRGEGFARLKKPLKVSRR